MIVAKLLQPCLQPLLAFCYPGQCACCQAPWEGPGSWCVACEQKLGELRGPGACTGCAMPLPRDKAPCPYCRGRGLMPYRDVLRLGVFREPLRGLIYAVKYHRRWDLGEALADRLFAEPAIAALLSEADCVMAVPLHWRRQMARGYNQSAVLAERLARRARRKWVRPAIRVRHTETQTHLHSRARRQENLRQAFVLTRAGARAIMGKHIVVVDDVMTTGATLQSLGRVLMKAKPARLSAIVLAIADPRGQGFERI